MPARFTGLAGPHLIRRAAPKGPPPMLVSLVLTVASGLMAAAFRTLRGDFSLTRWLPDLHLPLFPIRRTGRGGAGRPAAGTDDRTAGRRARVKRYLSVRLASV